MSWKWREKEEKQGLTVTLRDSGLCRGLDSMAHQQEVGGGPKSRAQFQTRKFLDAWRDWIRKVLERGIAYITL